MSHQTQLFGLRALAGQIEAERIKLLGDLPKPGDAAHMALMRRIDQWKGQISGIEKDLKSRSHFNQMIYDKNRFGADAYSAKQRFNSREGNVRELSNALAQVARVLMGLIKVIYDGPGGEERALNAMEHALSNWLDSVKHSQEGVMGPVPFQVTNTVQEIQVRTAPAEAPPALIPGPGGVDIFTLILAYFVLLKSLHKKS